jgi:hypothetical protein
MPKATATKTKATKTENYFVTCGNKVILETNSRERAYGKAVSNAKTTEKRTLIDRSVRKQIAYVEPWGVVKGEPVNGK